MAKQTFTTGQVLTAAQMTSLQQTAMGGGSTTAKTTSYVLTAADAGTVIQMNSASSTTITVNTALFAAGDTVQIQNIGAGVCTVTAGTATVNTAGSLALSQYEGGQLYFNTTSAAFFFDIVQSAGNGMTVISSGSLSSTSTLISSIPATYTDLVLDISNYTTTVSGWAADIRLNDDATANRHFTTSGVPIATGTAFNDTKILMTVDNGNVGSSSTSLIRVTIPNYANTTTWKLIDCQAVTQVAATPTNFYYQDGGGIYNQTAAISSFRILPNSGATIGGTYTLYGVK